MGRRPRSGGVQTVVACYQVFDKFFPPCGLMDYTDGMYFGDPNTPYDVAQRNQINHLLDEVQCRPGNRILEVGCGNGTLLDEVRRRNAKGVGITVTPEQVALCRRRGLDARLLDYKNLGPEWDRSFDAVVANGPIEHFVQPADAVQGKADAIYREMFRKLHRAIDPASSSRRFINTTIHFVRRPDPADLLKPPSAFPRGSDGRNWALLARSFGGYYPSFGQLERCAQGYFGLVRCEDGTYDYHLTSEEWLRRMKKALTSFKLVAIAARAAPLLLRHPVQLATMLRGILFAQAWNWQFRTADPPTRLLRQTWDYRPAAAAAT